MHSAGRRISYDKAEELLDKLVDINEKIAADEEVKAEKTIVYSRIVIIAAVLIGAFKKFGSDFEMLSVNMFNLADLIGRKFKIQ